MAFTRKNQRRFGNSNLTSNPADIARRDSEGLESRLLLSATDAGSAVDTDTDASEGKTEQSLKTASDEVESLDALFADPSLDLTSAHEAPATHLTTHASSLVTQMAWEAASQQAAVSADFPAPPSIPDGLKNDMTSEDTDAVDRANDLHSEIQDLRDQKAKCEEEVEELQSEVDARKAELDEANEAKDEASSKADDAKQRADDAEKEVNDQKQKLKDLQSQLQAARRARNNYARAVSVAGRLSRQARRQGDHDTAEGLGRQVGVNYRKYQEQVDKIRDLKSEIQKTRQDNRKAREESRKAKQEHRDAERDLRDAESRANEAQDNYDEAIRKLNEAKDKCRRLCDDIEAKEDEYTGEDGAHAAAVDAIEEGEERKEKRLRDEADEERRKEEEAEEQRVQQHFEDHNEVIRQDLELPEGTDPGDVTPGDINRLLGQQGGDIVPDDPTGEELAQAAVLKALSAQTTEAAISTLGYQMLGLAWDQLTGIFPLLGAINDLFDDIAEFQQFIEDFQNGNLKVEENIWAPQWGLVKTTTIYNCNTGQYIVTSQVLFYYPSGSQHAGGAGRDGISVDPKHAGAYTVTFVGTVS